MTALARRPWVPARCEDLIGRITGGLPRSDADAIERRILALVAENREIHERQCINLNPATNVMNPKAEALLARGLGSRPSLGYPGDKYEMGLEALEQIEVIAAALWAEIFSCRFAEIRVASGALANLYVFMATARPGDRIIVPDVSVGGHVTHHAAGAAGLYGLEIIPRRLTATITASTWKPSLISRGGCARSSSASVAASTSSRIRSAPFVRLPMRLARGCCSMPLTSAGSSPARCGPIRLQTART